MSFSVSQKRVLIVLAIFAAVLLIIIARLFFLQIVAASDLSKEAIESRTISYKVSPKRGTIYDRNGNVLAYSKDAKNVYANPSEIEDVKSTANTLAKILGGQIEDYVDKIDNQKLKFSYIKRRVDVEVADLIKAENLKGIYFEQDQKREYPYGRVAGQIIGCIDIDGNGLCGIEMYYDDVLRGSTGSTVKQQGNYGMPIPGGTLQDRAVINGQDIMLTVDVDLQQNLENKLEEDNQKLGTSSMHSIIMDPTNGEIYASASLPLFNPADLNNAQEGSTDLKCISTAYEPGSTFKSVAAMAILEYKTLTPDSQIYCPSTIQADEFTIKDARPRESQTFTFRQIMERSSNVGISLLTEQLGWDKFHDKIEEYKIQELTGIDYPGDTTGFMPDFVKWSKIHACNISFGQGLTVTPLQTCLYYSAISNNGYKPTPHFLIKYLQSDKEQTYQSTEVIKDKEAIATLNDVLKSVVVNGTGYKAKIEGYDVAGKTGTGEMTDDNGHYISNSFYSSFCGYLTNSTSSMLCFVGGERANDEVSVTDTWKSIMLNAIDRFRIAYKG